LSATIPEQRAHPPAHDVTRLQELLDALPALVSYVDENECNQYVNAAAAEWLGISPAEAEGRTVLALLGPERYAHSARYLHGALNGIAQCFERTRLDAAGTVRHSQVQYLPRFDADRPSGFYVLDTDITARVEAETEHLASVVQSALRQERARLAVEMQDLVLQSLYAAGLQLSLLEEEGDHAGAVDGALRKIQEAMELLRRSIRRLQSGTTASPLHAVLAAAAEASRWLGFPPDVDHAGRLDDVPEHLTEALLAVLTETLTQVVRHDNPDRVRIVVKAEGGWLTLEVTDDGCRPPEVTADGYIVAMRRSAELLAGSFEYRVVRPMGTVLRWMVPLPDRVAEVV
jgi:PAS domain S-box-containing protein